MLCGIFAWGLLFVVIFVYFTDSNPAEPAPSSFSFLETRRLLPMQGKQRAIMGAMQEPSLPESAGAHKGLLDGRPSGPFQKGPGDLPQWAQVRDGFENDEEFFSSQIGRKSQSAFYPEDDDYFFAAGQPGLHSHTQGTPGAPSPGDQGRRDGAALAHQAPRRRARKRQRKHGGSLVLEDGDDGDRLYSSMSRAFLHRLWKGNVSSKMLNPRLQKAMQDYLSANKHGVRFRGRRVAGLSRTELLCALRSRVRVRTLDGKEAPFSALGWQKLVPAVPLSQLHPRGLRSCAVVMSAGAILNSSLGEEIGGSRLRAPVGWLFASRLLAAARARRPRCPTPDGECPVFLPCWGRVGLLEVPAEVFWGAILEQRCPPQGGVREVGSRRPAPCSRSEFVSCRTYVLHGQAPSLAHRGLMNPYVVESWETSDRTREESGTPTGQ